MVVDKVSISSPATGVKKMKFHTLALAAAMTFTGAAFAAPMHHAHHMHHASMKHHRIVAMKHHHTMHMARRHEMRETTASVRTDMNADSRDVRMEQALQKYRASHG
jgi:hypothetical protein